MTTNTTLNLSSVQETVEDTIKSVRRASRKSVMAYVGFWGLAYDVTVKDRAQWLDKAEKRGESIEQDMTMRVTKLQKQAMHEAESMRSNVGQRVSGIKGNVNEAVNDVAGKLQAGLQKFLRTSEAAEMVQEIEVSAIENAKTVTKEVKKTAKKTATAAKKTVTKSVQNVEKMADSVIDALEKLELPFADYDQLAWNQIVVRVETLDHNTLIAVREYEMANRKRPSILKAIDAKLEPVVEPVVA